MGFVASHDDIRLEQPVWTYPSKFYSLTFRPGDYKEILEYRKIMIHVVQYLERVHIPLLNLHPIYKSFPKQNYACYNIQYIDQYHDFFNLIFHSLYRLKCIGVFPNYKHWVDTTSVELIITDDTISAIVSDLVVTTVMTICEFAILFSPLHLYR